MSVQELNENELQSSEDDLVESLLDEMHLADYERDIFKKLRSKFWVQYRVAHEKYKLGRDCQFQRGYRKAWQELINGVFNEEFTNVFKAWQLSKEQLPTELKALFPWDW